MITNADLNMAIARRKSVRRYKEAPVSAATRDALLERSGIEGLNRTVCRVEYIESSESLDSIYTGIVGSYGRITGARSMLCLIISARDLEGGRMEAGFLGEQYVLRATALGLGSCWVGGTFNYKKLMAHLSIGPEEAVAAVIALGWPEENRDTVSRLLHTFVRRKELASIASKELLAGPPWLKKALHAVQLAPSAINLQPWFFAGTPARVEIRATRMGTFTPMDLGIAMLHFALAAEENGYKGKWFLDREGHFFSACEK